MLKCRIFILNSEEEVLVNGKIEQKDEKLLIANWDVEQAIIKNYSQEDMLNFLCNLKDAFDSYLENILKKAFLSELLKKFAYLSLASIIFFAWGGRALIVLFPFALLLYIPFLIQHEEIIEFIKQNLIILIGLVSVLCIYLSFPDFTIYKYFPRLFDYPLVIFVNLRYVFLLGIFLSSLLVLYYQNILSKG